MPQETFAKAGTTRRGVLRLALASVGAAAAGPVLTACGEDDEGGRANPQQLTIGTAVDVINFDPYAQTTNALLALRLLNAWLLNYDENLKPVPDALKSYEVSKDRTKVTLTLRDDVVFTTGKTMTAEDVAFAFERARDPKRGANLAGPSQIIGAVAATGPHTVELTLTQPTNTGLIEDLLVGQPVIDKDHNSPGGLTQKPASAGPYVLDEWRPGQSLTLSANPKWYGGEVATKKVVVKVYTDNNAMVSALSSGSIDIAVYVPPKDGVRLQKSFQYLDSYPGAATMLLRVSTKTPPFDNKQVRQALQHCIDRERIVRDVLFGFGGPALLPWGPKSPAQDDSYRGRLTYDLDKAKQLLAGSGQLQGKAMVNGSDPVSIAVMQIIQSDLQKVGFKLEIEQIDAAAFQDRLVAGTFGVVLGQMGGGQLSLPRIVQNSLFRLSNNPLWANGKPPQPYIEAMNTLTTVEDEAARKAAYKKLNDTIVDESWAIATYYVPQLFMFKKELKGVSRDHQNALVLSNAKF